MLIVFISIASCQKSSIDEIAIVSEPMQISGDYKLMTVAYYKVMPDDASTVGIRFYETPRIIMLAKSHPDYSTIINELNFSRDNELPVRVTIESEDQIKSAARAGNTEIEQYKNLINAEESGVRTEYETVIASEEEMNKIFDYMQMQNCAEGTATIDYCIPFQYVVDGCYARAHKMKQILEDTYGYTCRKVFSFEGEDGFLAVDAGDCCVFWWYHVAPLVKVKEDDGIVLRVLDPSMFDKPVSIEKWTGAQENITCSPDTDWGYYEIRPASWYMPGGIKDPTYYWTNWTLDVYSDLETCD